MGLGREDFMKVKLRLIWRILRDKGVMANLEFEGLMSWPQDECYVHNVGNTDYSRPAPIYVAPGAVREKVRQETNDHLWEGLTSYQKKR
jgi:hypothetical protein